MEKARKQIFEAENCPIMIGSRAWVESRADNEFRRPADTDLIMSWAQFCVFIKEYHDYADLMFGVRVPTCLCNGFPAPASVWSPTNYLFFPCYIFTR
jgi:hypothetical protein